MLIQHLNETLRTGCTISSSSTTGTPKQIYRSPENISICNETAIKVQMLDKSSKVYTVTRMTHAGGLLLQTLPAYTLGCDILVETFNPYTFLDTFKNYTHTFLPPPMCETLFKVKNFDSYDFSDKIVCTGSDPTPGWHIQKFIDRGATVIANWGMSEIGPNVINKIYKPGDIADDLILGDTFWCDWKIEDSELVVHSPMCVYEGWFKTGDLVELQSNKLFSRGRK
jgi:acyl-CoA synthetase (AMP-forming)/AMP-acid ligase II